MTSRPLEDRLFPMSFGDVLVYDLAREIPTRLTTGASYGSPVWTPDGKYLIVGTPAAGIFWMRADGPSQPHQLVRVNGLTAAWSMTPDGKRLAYSQDAAGLMSSLWTVPLSEEGARLTAGQPELFPGPRGIQSAAFSPDGEWLAYATLGRRDAGQPARLPVEIWVRPFPVSATGENKELHISNNGGRNVVWSPSGELLYFEPGGNIMSVPYTVNNGAFDAGKPRLWASSGASGRQFRPFDVHPDGKRSAMVVPNGTAEIRESEPPRDHIVAFLFNFFDELRRRVPTN